MAMYKCPICGEYIEDGVLHEVDGVQNCCAGCYEQLTIQNYVTSNLVLKGYNTSYHRWKVIQLVCSVCAVVAMWVAIDKGSFTQLYADISTVIGPVFVLIAILSNSRKKVLSNLILEEVRLKFPNFKL